MKIYVSTLKGIVYHAIDTFFRIANVNTTDYHCIYDKYTLETNDKIEIFRPLPEEGMHIKITLEVVDSDEINENYYD